MCCALGRLILALSTLRPLPRASEHDFARIASSLYRVVLPAFGFACACCISARALSCGVRVAGETAREFLSRERVCVDQRSCQPPANIPL